MQDKIDDVLYPRRHILAMLVALMLPLKLSWTYVVLIPSILWYLSRLLRKQTAVSEDLRTLIAPLFFFLLTALISAPFGFDFAHSIHSLFKLSFFSLTIFFFADNARDSNPLRYIAAYLTGQCIASVYSVAQGAYPNIVPDFFLGPVTEAGQLAMAVPISLGVALTLRSSKLSNHFNSRDSKSILMGIVLLAVLSLLSFRAYFDCQTLCAAVLSVSALLIGLYSLNLKEISKPFYKCLDYERTISFIFPILLVALALNLKRGPWLGVGVACILLAVLYERKLLPALIFAGFGALLLDPINARLSASYQDFIIAGGRSEIWSIGKELAIKFPLGIGFNNNAVLQDFSIQIPAELTHFHSNFINIVVETGWLGLACFLWWIISIFSFVVRSTISKASKSECTIVASIGVALLSWQVAGIVEYNFGDSEVVLLAFMLIGLLPAAKAQLAQGSKDQA